MSACSPQRFLANNRNVIREALLTPSSVLTVEDNVLPIVDAPIYGSATVKLTGPYTGAESATYDIGIIDGEVETRLISARVPSGEGTGTLDNISAGGPAQEITVELSESGLPLLAAAVDFEGVTVKARTSGAVGNSIYFNVDQSPLVFTPQNFSLLNDLAIGSGGEGSPLTGSEFDFDTAVLGADNLIPTAAHRISFGTDTSAIYLQYKAYKDGEWKYYFVPELKRAVPRGTVINFVTGGRTVKVYPGSPPETYTDIVTLYDLLIALQTTSQLVMVDGVVANDRSPTGQASHELQTRTDAHFQPSYGEGSDAARGFENVSVEADAGTQLVVATCVAVTPNDNPAAGVGRTLWQLNSSILGDLGTIVENELFEITDEAPAGQGFSLKVPQRLPYGLDTNTQKGNFTIVAIEYETRAEGEPDPPPICPGVGDRAGRLGPNAVDQTLTLVWTKRPSGDCLCADMPIPDLGGQCLGVFDSEGGAAMAYSTDARSRFEDLYDWADELAKICTLYRDGYQMDGIPETATKLVSAAPTTGTFTAPDGTQYTLPDGMTTSGTVNINPTDAAAVGAKYADVALPPDFQACIDFYETGIKEIDAVTDTGDKTAGFTEWDAALQEFKDDLSASPLSYFRLATVAFSKYKILVKRAMAYAGVPQLGKSDASTVSGDGCWQDYGGNYFTVEGSVGGAYAPLFPNTKYYSSRRADAKGAYVSTHEFAIFLAIKCPQNLKFGDRIRIASSGASWPSAYQVGDKQFQPIVAANDLFLAGGRDASLVLLWLINGSASGPFPTFSYDPDAPAGYDSLGAPIALAFTYTPGGIPNVKGDRFSFFVEGGHWQWRKNAGAWNVGSPPDPIPAGPVALDAGLSVEFIPGAAPSFVAGDVYSFKAFQPWAVSNLRTPTVEPWKWSGSSASYESGYLGSIKTIDMSAIGLHALPEGATITVEGGTVEGVYVWLETLTWRKGVILGAFAATHAASYLRHSVANAAGGSISWWWTGEGLATLKSAEVVPKRTYSISRGEGGLNPTGRFLGKGRGADVAWTRLGDTDMAAIADMVESVKENHDEPLIFVPQITRPEEAMLVSVAGDEMREHDEAEGNANDDVARVFDVQLSLGAFLQ